MGIITALGLLTSFFLTMWICLIGIYFMIMTAVGFYVALCILLGVKYNKEKIERLKKTFWIVFPFRS